MEKHTIICEFCEEIEAETPEIALQKFIERHPSLPPIKIGQTNIEVYHAKEGIAIRMQRKLSVD